VSRGRLQLASLPTGASFPQPAEHQGRAGQYHQLALAAAAVLPQWGPGEVHLQVLIPQPLAATCKRIRFEIGGVLLPSQCTDALKLRPWVDQLYVVGGLHHAKPLIQGAELLPCRGLLMEGTGGQGSQQGSLQWELVLCVRWHPAPVGQEVCT
jgi:hypothetical protein